MGLPALVLDESGYVIEANELMNGFQEHLQWRAGNRVALSDVRSNEMLWAALPELNGDKQEVIRSFVLRGKDGGAASVAYLVPIRRSAHDIFARAHALLVLTP
ncbi:MAG: hypothetical protein ACKO1L_03440, partial [Brachymonas sp.]